MPAAIIEYNIRNLTVLQYIAMLSPLPVSVLKTERHLLHKILHLPPNALGQDELLDLDAWGVAIRVFCRRLGCFGRVPHLMEIQGHLGEGLRHFD